METDPDRMTTLDTQKPDKMVKGKGKGRTLVITPRVDIATAKALRYMARSKQCRMHISASDFPSRSRYSFTNPERMEG